jgi:hypothetical protein
MELQGPDGRSLGRLRLRIALLMKVGDAIAEIMKREGIEILCGYPVNHLLEYAAKADIRPVIVRQERIGLHMADAISRVTSGARSARSACSTARARRTPMAAWRRRILNRCRCWCCRRAMRAASRISIRTSAPARDARMSKIAEPVTIPANSATSCAARSAICATAAAGPAIVEIPTDIWNEEIGELDYTPVGVHKYGPDRPMCARRPRRSWPPSGR